MSAPARQGARQAAALPDLRALEVFTAVAEAGSMTAAAARLGLSQSGVSQAVRHLEDDLGVCLVDRSVRPSALTRAGQDLYSRARRLLADVGEATQAVRRAAQAGEVQLRVGLVDSVAVSAGPVLARHLRDTGGGCHLLSGQSAMHAEALRRRALDLVITSDDTLVEQPGLAVHPLVAEPMILVLPGSYRGPADDLQRIVETLELVAYSERAALGRQVALHLNRRRLSPRCTLAFDSSDAVFAMVAAGLGFAVTTPLCLLQGRERLQGVRIAPLPGPTVRRHLSVGHHAGELDALAEQIGSVTVAALRQHALPAIRGLGEWLTRELWFAEGGER